MTQRRDRTRSRRAFRSHDAGASTPVVALVGPPADGATAGAPFR